MDNTASVLGKDIPWNTIDGHLLKLINFIPQEKSFFNPYAFAAFEGKTFRGTATLPVFQRTDFKNLSDAWKVRKEDEEILIFWSVRYYSSKVFKLFSAILPKLWIRICPKDSYKIESDNSFKPDLQGEARFLAAKAIKEWKPEVME
jgi:hypothetical protein